MKVLGKILITSHERPDPDAIASMILLQKQFGGRIWIRGNTTEVGKRLLKMAKPPIAKHPYACDTFIVVDTNNIKDIEGFLVLSKRRILIDHHEEKELPIRFEESYIDPAATSSVQIVLRLLRPKLDPVLAKIALIGMISDSAFFKSGDPEFFFWISKLLKHVDYNDVLSDLNSPRPLSERMARLKGSKNMQIFKGNFLAAMSTVSAYEGSVANGLLGLGADLAIVGNKKKGRIEVRCRPELVLKGINLGEIMKKVGELIGGDGGGHPAAAGAKGKRELIDKGMKKVLYLARKMYE